MFREITRFKQALPHDECIHLLESELRGVLAVSGDNGYPYTVPLNHFYNPEDGKLYFHSGKTGHKIDALRNDSKASYCVLDHGVRPENQWAYYFRSVIVFGKIEFIQDPDIIRQIARKLSLKFTDDEAYIQHEIEKSGPSTLLFALIPEHITGKLVHEA